MMLALAVCVLVSLCLQALYRPCVICQCLRVYFFGDIFKEWFGTCESQVSLLMPFYSCPTSNVSFQCNYDLLDLNH